MNLENCHFKQEKYIQRYRMHVNLSKTKIKMIKYHHKQKIINKDVFVHKHQVFVQNMYLKKIYKEKKGYRNKCAKKSNTSQTTL